MGIKINSQNGFFGKKKSSDYKIIIILGVTIRPRQDFFASALVSCPFSSYVRLPSVIYAVMDGKYAGPYIVMFVTRCEIHWRDTV